ncbi:MAG: ribosome maturation factor RimM [Flavobacteriales bacterium]
MYIEDCFYLGTVIKKHGYKGDFIAKFEADDVLLYQGIEAAFFDLKGELIPFPLSKCEFLKKDTFLMHIDGFDSEEDLRKILQSDLYLPLDVLPQLKDDEFYYHEVIDFLVIDKHKGALGKLKDIRTDTAQDVVYITSYENLDVEILIPLSDAVFQGLDKTKKEFYIEAPAGLIDLYFEDNHQQDEH